MASRLPLPVVGIMVMASLLALLLLLQSSAAAAAAEPHIEMVVNNNKNQSSSSSSSSERNDYCHYQITVRTSGWVLGSGTDSTLTFYLYDNYGNVASVSQDGAPWPWFESNHNNVLDFFDGPCISQPCVLVVTTDGAGSYADWMMSWLKVVVTAGTTVQSATFYNGSPGSDGGDASAVWLGPSNKQMRISIC